MVKYEYLFRLKVISMLYHFYSCIYIYKSLLLGVWLEWVIFDPVDTGCIHNRKQHEGLRDFSCTLLEKHYTSTFTPLFEKRKHVAMLILSLSPSLHVQNSLGFIYIEGISNLLKDSHAPHFPHISRNGHAYYSLSNRDAALSHCK